MKTNQVAMPHQMVRPGDFCIVQSVIDAHPGNMWLYYWLPGDPKEDAVRISTDSYIDGNGPRVMFWNGDRTTPSLSNPLTAENGKRWMLTEGELNPL